MLVVSGGELYVARQAGFPAERIHFHGNNQSAAELAAALDEGVGRIVVDNFHELDVLERLAVERRVRVSIWLRLSPGNQLPRSKLRGMTRISYPQNAASREESDPLWSEGRLQFRAARV